MLPAELTDGAASDFARGLEVRGVGFNHRVQARPAFLGFALRFGGAFENCGHGPNSLAFVKQ